MIILIILCDMRLFHLPPSEFRIPNSFYGQSLEGEKNEPRVSFARRQYASAASGSPSIGYKIIILARPDPGMEARQGPQRPLGGLAGGVTTFAQPPQSGTQRLVDGGRRVAAIEQGEAVDLLLDPDQQGEAVRLC